MTGPLVVTGGTGLLGAAVRRLCPGAVCLSRADGDLRDFSVARRLIDELRPSRVLHLAGCVGGVKANAAQNSRFFEENALINASVLSAARMHRVPRLIAVLSSCAFPVYADRATSEADVQAHLPYDGNAGYAQAKRMLDTHIRLVAKEDGLAWTTITPVTMYGPHDSFEPESGHVVGALIRRCHEAMTRGSAYTVWGSGQAVRQFVFVEDVARVLLAALNQPMEPGTTIVAPDEGVSIRVLAESVARACGYQGPIRYDRSQPEGVLVKRLRSERFSASFPGFQFTPLQVGLDDTVRWFRDHGTGSTVKTQAGCCATR